MIQISELTPLNFDTSVGDKWHGEEYLHRWYFQDDIMLQVLLTGGSSMPKVYLDNLTAGTSTQVTMSSYTVSTGYVLRYALIHLSAYTTDGVCRIRLRNFATSEPFLVCSDPALLDETTLIRVGGTASDTSLKPFAVYYVGGIQQIFQMRVPCGIKPTGYLPRLEAETYRTQTMDVMHLWQMPYETFTLTIGNAAGLPWWMARYVNNMMCAPIVEIGSHQYRRSDDAVPSLAETFEGSGRFVLTQLIERVPEDKKGTLYLGEFNNDYNNDYTITQ